MPLIRKDGATGAEAPRSPARLDAASADERWAAARALGHGPADVGVLATALAREECPRVREAILTSLAQTQCDEAVLAIVPLVRSDAAEVRTAALDALRAMPAVLVPHLGQLLADADPDVRILVCDLARPIGADSVPVLCEVLLRDPEVNVCAAAVDAIAELGDERAVPALIACRERFSDAVFLHFAIQATIDRISAPPRA